ncbi:coiled-coil domain-containing protein 14-like [Liolophura sinensis]|uniref:coiled-coil domain-containing protein 14-like n=1 Tax=Liolophura sinensis TaxID=3198878 RepID=UPI0031587CE7
MEAIMTALAKVRNDLEQARSETADLREELHSQQSKNMELQNQLEMSEMEKQRLVQEVSDLRDTVDQMNEEKRKFGQNFKDELRELLS